MYYRHDLDYKYPERSDQHMLVLKRTKEIKLDESYDYMPKGAWFMIKRALVASVLHLIVFPLTHLTHGLHIYGKENLKKHKKELKNGAVSTENSVANVTDGKLDTYLEVVGTGAYSVEIELQISNEIFFV